MQVQVNSDHHIAGDDELRSRVHATVEAALGRFGERVTRVEVHLSDENSAKGGHDKKCVMEARPVAMKPMAASHVAATVDQAVSGAAAKLERRLDRTFERRFGVKRKTSRP